MEEFKTIDMDSVFPVKDYAVIFRYDNPRQELERVCFDTEKEAKGFADIIISHRTDIIKNSVYVFKKI